MNKKQIKEKVEEIVAMKNRIDYLHKQLREIVTMSPESELVQVLHGSLDLSIDILDEITNGYDWVNWFVWVNDCGKHGLTAGRNGILKPIKTLDEIIRDGAGMALVNAMNNRFYEQINMFSYQIQQSIENKIINKEF